MNYDELTDLRTALQTVATLGPKYVKPTYLQGIFNALGNVEKQIAEIDDQEPLRPLL